MTLHSKDVSQFRGAELSIPLSTGCTYGSTSQTKVYVLIRSLTGTYSRYGASGEWLSVRKKQKQRESSQHAMQEEKAGATVHSREARMLCSSQGGTFAPTNHPQNGCRCLCQCETHVRNSPTPYSSGIQNQPCFQTR